MSLILITGRSDHRLAYNDSTKALHVVTVDGLDNVTDLGAITPLAAIDETTLAAMRLALGYGLTFTPVAIAQVATPGALALSVGVSGKLHRLHALWGSMNIAGKVQIHDATAAASTTPVAALTGAMDAAITGGWVIPYTSDSRGVPTAHAVAHGILMVTTTGGFNGFAITSTD
jgi:hypothetical protein